jgi:pimeloyl-ACP methyl ester carboxylesterase
MSPRPDHRLLVPEAASAAVEGRPLIVCFPGSGAEEKDAASPPWMALAVQLVQRGHAVLIFARGAGDTLDPTPATIAAFRRYLAARRLAGPYVLVAHSYGGAFARAFLQAAPADVAGLVLAETGQEGGLDPRVDDGQLRHRAMGAKPVVVIHANIFLTAKRAIDARDAALALAAFTTPADHAFLAAQQDLLRRSEAEDKRLKQAQLRLSSTSKYVHLPDCGHHVVRDRPDVIAGEVDWVFANLRQDDGVEKLEAAPRVWSTIRKALARLSR